MKAKNSGLSYDYLRQNSPKRLSKEAILTLDRGYLGTKETPFMMNERLANTAASSYPQGYGMFSRADIRDQLLEAFNNCLISPASPVASNFGVPDGFPVSCYGVEVENTLDDIGLTVHEIMMLTKGGGGIGIDISNLIGSSKITAWAKIIDTVISKCSQKGVRRGSVAQYLSIWHPDVDLFLEAKNLVKGDPKQKLECNIAIKLDRKFRQLLTDGDSWALNRFDKIMKMRMKYGSPYIYFTDNVLDADPPWYKDKGLRTIMSQLCTEIFLATIPREVSFSCVLSSMNLRYGDEWLFEENPNKISLPELGIILLDAVNDDFVLTAKSYKRPDGYRKAIAGAEKGGPLGLGVYGLSAYFMSKSLPFDSLQARGLNKRIFRWIKEKAERATLMLASIKGEREWTKGWNRRNTHLIAIAPTTTSSLLGGGYTPGIQPLFGNIFSKSGAKGTFIRKNPFLIDVLEKYGKNTSEVWTTIRKDMGSVKNLDFLSDHEKLVFRTFFEIPPKSLVEMAVDRQPDIDQGQSFNLAVSPHIPAQELVDAHLLGWDNGLKTFYYIYSESEMNEQVDFEQLKVFIRSREDCIYCQKAKKLLTEFNIEYTEEVKPQGRVPEIWINGEMLEDGYSSLVRYLEGTEDAEFLSEDITDNCVSCDA